MQDRAIEIDDLEDLDAVERPFVPRLSAGLGIKGRPVEDDGREPFLLRPVHDFGFELEEIRVVEVQPLRRRHRHSPAGRPGDL